MTFRGLRAGLIIPAIFAGAVCSAQAPVPEYQAKVVLLEKLTRFVEWPSQDFHSVFHLAIVGRTPFGDGLEDYFASHLVKNRRVSIAYFSDAKDIGHCDLLFIASSEKGRLEAILARVKGRPILTVADTPGLAQRGVMVNLIREGSRMVFEVNLDPVRASNLRMHPGFLQLARITTN